MRGEKIGGRRRDEVHITITDHCMLLCSVTTTREWLKGWFEPPVKKMCRASMAPQRETSICTKGRGNDR